MADKPLTSRGVLDADSISALCYQLALMQRAGISSEESFSLLLTESASPRQKQLNNEIYKSLCDGSRLSDALAATGAFPGYMIRMIEIGHVSGRLEQVLYALSDFYRKESDIQSAIRKAVSYPMGMAFLIALVFLVLISRVLPVFEQVFSQLGIALSPIAKGLMSFGSASKYVAAGMSVVLIVAAVLALFMLKTQSGKRMASKLFGRLMQNSRLSQCVMRSRFASAMSLMLSSGLHIDEAMERTEQLLEGSAIAPKIAKCREYMADGKPFAESVEASGILTGLQAGLLSSGFRVGLSEQAMDELSSRCQSEADERLAALLSRFEYSMVILLCVSVGLVLLSVMLPLLSVLSGIGA